MISESSVNIIKDICQFMAEGGGDCTQWRIGATADIEQVLYVDQGISRNYRWQIYRRAQSAEEAQAIVMGFRNLSCEECPACQRGRGPAVYVYAYLKKPLLEISAG